MIQFFRRFFASKIGLAITIAFVGLIGLAFASMDVSGSGTFGGISGGDRVAVVGDAKIGTAELRNGANSGLEEARQSNPTLSMQAFVEGGGLESTINRLIDRFALNEYARMAGLRAGDNLVNSEIMQIGAFAGPDGSFDQQAYLAALRQRNLTDAQFRRDVTESLMARQLVSHTLLGNRMPDKIALRYASLLRERRKGAIALIPSSAYAPKGEPTAKQLQAFYEANRGRYIRPERRTLRYAGFDASIVENRIAPTDAEIAARYERDKAQYSASQARTFTQLIVPTQQAAESLRSRAQSGASLDTLAREAGFSTSKVGPITRSELVSTANEAVAKAAFDAARGAVAAPARSPLGWHVMRVDAVDTKAARSLAQVTPEIREALTNEKRLTALADVTAQIEEELDGGASLSEIAKTYDLTLRSTPALTADGRIYGQPESGSPDVLMPIIETAFQMEEGEPQLAEVTRGQNFIVFEVQEVTPSATAPMDEIKDRLVAAWRLSEGSRLAKAASDRIIAAVRKGTSLAEAMQAEKVALPPVDQIDLNRQQLVTQSQQVPPPLVLLFSMAEGTVKRLEGASDIGWFVVDLDDISVEPIAKDDPLVAATKQNLGPAIGNEYASQLVAAIKEEIGVERNETAIEAVRKQLTGES
ncbi:Peptidyl-prolyl cis-trans isomerase PpiD [Altererythrobacter epoxidivorans]|uniref:Parvulin-like PPIase n=1 Tax=Altererythrobacter epoxidivorans TaxID=361183 RepID=A0A0M4LUC3_9SPHN|nr:peptidylprolyl isomerase [Altererythrobacter epoxidivorans]ALE16517.1 Peptidyl-prolyl cis-trans isomerase PpiD [Altererythrobacter epoxidivorans]